MEDRRTKMLPKIILGQSAVTLLIAIVSLSIIFYAEGYHINFQTMKVERDGAIHLVSYPKDASVYINGVKKQSKTPYSALVTPDYYTMEVKKTGFLDWSVTAKIDPDFVAEYKNIVLFKDKPVISNLTDNGKIDMVNSPSNALANPDGLYYNNYELWVKDELIARFSTPIKNAIWYSDGYHIIYQRGNQLRVIDSDGQNDDLLVTLANDQRTNFAVNGKGNELYYLDNGKYYTAIIRDN